VERLKLNLERISLPLPDQVPTLKLKPRLKVGEVMDTLAKGATLREAAVKHDSDLPRIGKMLQLISKEYEIDVDSYRVVSLESLSRLSAKLWEAGIMSKNPWRTIEFLLRIEERKAALLGLDKGAAQGDDKKISIGTVQSMILQYNSNDKNLRIG
jgi:hypothetical protein